MLKAIHIISALLLQKPSKTPKGKDHLKALERRLRLWEEGNTTELVNESKTIPERLPSTNSHMNIEKRSYKFKQLMPKKLCKWCTALINQSYEQWNTITFQRNFTNAESETSISTTSSPQSNIPTPKKTNTQYRL